MKRPLVITAIVVALAGAIFASVQYYLDWRLPRATATVQVVFPTLISQEGAGQIITGPATHQFEFNDPVELALDSTEVKKAAQDAQVDQDRLLKIASTHHIPDTNLIEIVVKHESRSHAVALANAFANGAIRLQEEHNQERVKTHLQSLKDELADQENHFKTKGHELRSLMEEFTLQIPKMSHQFPGPGDIPKFAEEKPSQYFHRQENYRKALEAFHESKAKLQETTARFPEASATMAQRSTSMIVQSYAR